MDGTGNRGYSAVGLEGCYISRDNGNVVKDFMLIGFKSICRASAALASRV